MLSIRVDRVDSAVSLALIFAVSAFCRSRSCCIGAIAAIAADVASVLMSDLRA